MMESMLHPIDTFFFVQVLVSLMTSSTHRTNGAILPYKMIQLSPGQMINDLTELTVDKLHVVWCCRRIHDDGEHLNFSTASL